MGYMSNKGKYAVALVAFTATILIASGSVSLSPISPVSGALFTTDSTGLQVNGNIYSNKNDVYISGGPGPNAPDDAAGLPDGEYYFQVTNPSGKTLLSKDSVGNRKILIQGGVIVAYIPQPALICNPSGSNCKLEKPHVTAPNLSTTRTDDIVIQLMPYDNTPNKGGVYKAWTTPVSQYSPGQGFFGFIPSFSKTDNYKVITKPTPVPSAFITIEKFYDSNANGLLDSGEQKIPWLVTVTDPLGVTNIYQTPITLDVSGLSGNFVITELAPTTQQWLLTALIVNGQSQPLSQSTTVFVQEPSKRTGEVRHTILFGNVAIGAFGGGHTPGFWQNKNGQELLDLNPSLRGTVNGLAPWSGPQDFYPAAAQPPFDSNEEIGDFVVHEISTVASDPRFQLSRFALVMKLNIDSGPVDPNALIFVGQNIPSLGITEFDTIEDVVNKVIADFELWKDFDAPWDVNTIRLIQKVLDDAANNKNFVFTSPPSPICFGSLGCL